MSYFLGLLVERDCVGEKLELKFPKRVISVLVTKTKEGPSQAVRQPRGDIHIRKMHNAESIQTV